jgi:hypothetical protein
LSPTLVAPFLPYVWMGLAAISILFDDDGKHAL